MLRCFLQRLQVGLAGNFDFSGLKLHVISGIKNFYIQALILPLFHLSWYGELMTLVYINIAPKDHNSLVTDGKSCDENFLILI